MDDSIDSRLTPHQRDELTAEIARFPRATGERGRRYAVAGRVATPICDGTSIAATVRGTDLYETVWEWIDGEWVPECSCPVGPYCKHAYALACCVLAGEPARARRQHAGPRLSDLLAARRTSALERLRAAPDPWTRQQQGQVLLQRAVAAGLMLHQAPFDEIFEEADPDLLCWRLAQAVGQRVGTEWLPPALDPYVKRADLAERYAQRARTALAGELVQWAEQQRHATQRRLRLVFDVQPDHRGGACITVEARLTTPRMADEPRTLSQLGQLRNDLRHTPGLLPTDQAALLEWFVDSNAGGSDTYVSGYGGTYGKVHRLNGSALRTLLSRVADSALATWTDDLAPAVTTRGGLTPGAPVRLHPTPARLLPACVPRDGALWVDLLFHWPDGTPRRVDEVLYLRGAGEWSRTHPSFVIADGAFSLVIEEPPEPLIERFQSAGGLPLPSDDRDAILGGLAAHFPHVRDSLAAHTYYHAVRPVVALDLRDDDWLQIRLFAYTGTDTWQPHEPHGAALVFEYSPRHAWERCTESSAAGSGDALGAIEILPDIHTRDTPRAAPVQVAAAEVWIEAPDPRYVEPAMQWLAATEAASGTVKRPGGHQPRSADHDTGWWLMTSPQRMQAFAELWEQRPPGVSFFGTPRVQRLLRGELRVTPRLHISSSGLDWFAVSAEWEAEGLQLSDADLAKLRAATTRFVKLSSGWVRREAAALHDEAAAVLADLGIDAGAGTQRLSLWQLAGAAPESLAALERFGADAATLKAARRLREKVARFAGLPGVPPPDGFTAALRAYQRRGLDFLAYTASLGIGAVLADDMGLGKTIQALAWLLHLRAQEPEGGPSLVVCPASVVHNWAREAARFAPGLRVLLLTRGQARHALRDEIPAHDLVITNYALLRRDLAAWETIALRAAIFDEAQNLKNPDAAVTRAAAALQARHRLALTGTPLENRALDLWSISQVVNPGYLGGRAAFERRFDRLDAPPHVRTLLAAKLRPVLLRRTKQEVATDLPERIEERRDCELTKGQRQLYLAELRRSRALVERLSGAPGGITQNKIHILAALTRLRQICCHPALAGGKRDLGSGKFEALFELLEPLLDEGHKVLVFSQFVECLKLLKAELAARRIAHHVLTGATAKRQQVVDAFQGDPRPGVFLISLKAGGTGLNLTAASYVVLFDPWWNPAVEAQAIDRTHRIGQDRTVIAYRMLAAGTIEEKIWELQQRKAALARDILGEGSFARALTRGDLDYLLADA